MLIEKIDVKKYLNDKRILFLTEGKNISSNNWIGVNCPFCPDGDPSSHLGINLYSGNISCWRCNTRGSFLKYIKNIERCSYEKAKKIISSYSSGELQSFKEELENRQEFEIPKTIPLTNIHSDYLESRGFDVNKLKMDYKIASFPPSSMGFKNRIYIPIYYHHNLVSYIGRTPGNFIGVTKYKNCPNEKSVLNIKDCLYNIDTITNTAIVVEGTTDVWRIGKGCVAILGKKFTSEQILKLSNINRIFILLDSDAEEASNKLANSLCSFVKDVYIYTIDKKDPAELSDEDVKNIRKDVFSKIY